VHRHRKIVWLEDSQQRHVMPGHIVGKYQPSGCPAQVSPLKLKVVGVANRDVNRPRTILMNCAFIQETCSVNARRQIALIPNEGFIAIAGGPDSSAIGAAQP
jgi:hypothetical protein